MNYHRLITWCQLFAGLCTILLCAAACSADVLVVTDRHHPIKGMHGIRVIELDQAEQLKTRLSHALPIESGQANALAKQRLLDGGRTLQQQFGEAYQDVVDAWALGITHIPAVVVDRRYVVYGEPDVVKAVALIAAYRRDQP